MGNIGASHTDCRGITEIVQLLHSTHHRHHRHLLCLRAVTRSIPRCITTTTGLWNPAAPGALKAVPPPMRWSLISCAERQIALVHGKENKTLWRTDHTAKRQVMAIVVGCMSTNSDSDGGRLLSTYNPTPGKKRTAKLIYIPRQCGTSSDGMNRRNDRKHG